MEKKIKKNNTFRFFAEVYRHNVMVSINAGVGGVAVIVKINK